MNKREKEALNKLIKIAQDNNREVTYADLNTIINNEGLLDENPCIEEELVKCLKQKKIKVTIRSSSDEEDDIDIQEPTAEDLNATEEELASNLDDIEQVVENDLENELKKYSSQKNKKGQVVENPSKIYLNNLKMYPLLSRSEEQELSKSMEDCLKKIEVIIKSSGVIISEFKTYIEKYSKKSNADDEIDKEYLQTQKRLTDSYAKILSGNFSYEIKNHIAIKMKKVADRINILEDEEVTKNREKILKKFSHYHIQIEEVQFFIDIFEDAYKKINQIKEMNIMSFSLLRIETDPLKPKNHNFKLLRNIYRR